MLTDTNYIAGVVGGASLPQPDAAEAKDTSIVSVVQAELKNVPNLAKLARKVGVDRTQLWLFQRAGVGIGLTNFDKLAQALGVKAVAPSDQTSDTASHSR